MGEMAVSDVISMSDMKGFTVPLPRKNSPNWRK
jgi:hypothetical protein